MQYELSDSKVINSYRKVIPLSNKNLKSETLEGA